MDDCLHPMFFDPSDMPPNKARFLKFQRCSPGVAVDFVRRHHSRLPNTQRGPWMYSFIATRGDLIVSSALWNNCSARTLPAHWVELRRMACSEGAPRYTPSRFLAWMRRWLQRNAPQHEMMVSYQDPVVHSGTIYKASGWSVAHVARDRARDRSKTRRGSDRQYRTNINGADVDSVGKVRWQRIIA